MFYRIGLDIGITSVGWCAVETYENGEPKGILDLGVRIFDAAENAKDGAPLAEPRRLARGLRRRLRRRANRIACAKELFRRHGIIPSAGARDVNELRVEGLDKPLTPEELAAVAMLLIKRRGFKSNSKAQTAGEDGKLLEAVRKNAELMREKGYRTVGEMLARECSERATTADGKERTIYRTRNKGDQYTHTVARAAIRSELELIFDAQARFGNELASEDVKTEVLRIFDFQRNFDEGPGNGSPYSADYKVGKCEFEQSEERAPKASYSFDLFYAYQKINHLRILSSGASRELTAEEREKVVEVVLKNKKTSYSRLRKLLALSDDERFNGLSYYSKKKRCDDIAEAEKETFVTLERSRAILDRLDDEHKTGEVADAVAYVLTHAKSDSKRRSLFAALPETKDLSENEIGKLLELNAGKFGHLSLKAIRNILPYLEKGYRYDEACAAYGYHHSKKEERARGVLLKGEEIRLEQEEINSPVTRRAVSQTIKVLNALIIKYGSPVAVNIELAREMSRSRAERDKDRRENESRRKFNDSLRDEIRTKYGKEPTRTRLIMMKLREEQGGKCPYTGEFIDPQRIFEDNYVQIDHIVPYSRGFDDSFNNKVLVKTHANQEKGNRLPFEWLFTTDRWNGFVDRVCVMYANNYKKKQNLLKESLDEDEWKARALNDTRYISRYMLGLMEQRLVFAESEVGKRKVMAVNGGITAELRRQWGIGKVREDGDLHHAVDAAVIACVTAGTVQKLSRAYRMKHEEKRRAEDDLGVNIVEPYAGFADELAARCLANTDAIRDRLKELGADDAAISNAAPVFVSRMPRRKGKGPIHKETIYSAKHFGDEGVVVKKVPLTALKLGQDADGNVCIKDYFRKEDDPAVYSLLLEKLIAADGKAEVAFKDKVFKPAAAGRTPNEIKKVKIAETATSGVMLEGKNGFAANGGMVRVDVFSKGGKYYCVPVYTSDIYAGRLPNRAATAGKRFEDWDIIDDTYAFEFALYHNDLIWVRHKSGIKLVKQRDNVGSKMPDTYEIKEGFVYFLGFDISTASARVITHDNCYGRSGLGLKTLEEIRKCNVDVLGNITFVKSEKRPPAAMKSESERGR